MDNYITRVIWEGEILEYVEHGDYENIANAHYSSTVDKYRRKDDSEGVTVQLILGDDVLYEHYFTE